MGRRLSRQVRETATDTKPMAGVVAAAPDGPDVPLEVTLDAYGHRVRHDAYGWAPRGDETPVVGDRVAVIRADDGDLWVLAWHPSGLDAA